MFPPSGSNGWELLGTVATQAPVIKALPVAATGFYYDPSRLGGIGTVLDSVTLSRGRSACVVRARASVVEATFTQRDVFGAILLDSFETLFGAACTLLLTVYNDDRTTERWSVSTDPAHPRPFLEEPDHYAEQELDVAAGAATLGTVNVTISDHPLVPGDQDGGYVTNKLASLSLADLAGRRCRLVRFISASEGFVVIADGPASAPRMHASYAAFSFDIRDTRETERKVRCFDLAPPVALLPDEHLEGYGFDAASDTYLVIPAQPLLGRFDQDPFEPHIANINLNFTDFPAQLRRRLISAEAFNAIEARNAFTGLFEESGGANRIKLTFRWRLAGSADPWNEIPNDMLGLALDIAYVVDSGGHYLVGTFILVDPRVNPANPLYVPGTFWPNDGDHIEFLLIGQLPTSERHPTVLETPELPATIGVFNLANTPVLGRFSLVTTIAGITSGTVDLTAVPGNAEGLRRQRIGILDLLPNLSTVGDVFIPATGTLQWRLAAGGPWTSIPLNDDTLGSSCQLIMTTPFTYVYRIFETLIFTAVTALMPADNDDIEIRIQLENPLVPLTAGQLAANVYAGLYSARDASGAVQPTGIRYDEAALLLMTDRVRIRLTEPIEDARDWLEEHIYAPTGWVPALDALARISPVSQEAPTDLSGLPALDNAMTEPSSQWNAGERIVNVLRFTYPRDFTEGPIDTDAILTAFDPVTYDAPALAAATEQTQNVVESEDQLLEFQDTPSIVRHGQQLLELTGDAFRAIGKLEVSP